MTIEAQAADAQAADGRARADDLEAVDYIEQVVADDCDMAFEPDANGMIRTPSGRLVPALPLTAPVPALRAPFHRNPTTEPAPRWIGVFLALCAVLFVPYIVVLGMTLPGHATAAHYDAAWVGLDVMELIALGLTAWFAWTRSTWIALSSTAGATLLVCDAWFDVVTARGIGHLAMALAGAVLIELPMAGFCVWIARHAEVVHERATLMLLRRSAKQAEKLRAYEKA
jgi:hypothetical protein